MSAADHFATELRKSMAQATEKFAFIADLDPGVKREVLLGMACAFAIGAISVIVDEPAGDLDPAEEIRQVLAGLALVRAELVVTGTETQPGGEG